MLHTEHEHTGDDEAMTTAVRTGDEAGFSQAASRYRAELRVHCYRLLGSLADSEDLVQETLLKAWRAREQFEGRAAVRSWLYRIATNACLDFLKSKEQRLSGGVVTSAEPELGSQPHVAWLQPYPDRLLEGVPSAPDSRLLSREALELGYMVALQCLPAKQRAALICCDVLDWSAKETAELLSLSVPAVNAALQRARATLENEQETGVRRRPAATTSDEERALLERYVRATEQLDTAALTALLRHDLRFSMPPAPARYADRDAAMAAWIEGGYGGPDCRDFRCLLTRANRMPAVAVYRRRDNAAKYQPMALDVLVMEGGLITEITTFDLEPLVEAFGLPPEL